MLILTLLRTPIGIRRIVPVVVLITIVVTPIIAIVTTIGSLILRIESIIASQSCVIILETNLTLDRAPTTMITTAVEATTSTAITTTKTLQI